MNQKFLNENCACRTFDPTLLKGVSAELMQTHPNLFSATTVFISPEQLRAMTSLITAIEETAQLSEFKKLVTDRAPSIAKVQMGTKGVFMGYDFHLSDEGPKLIEINTNAGGALLNLELAQAQEICCQACEGRLPNPVPLSQLERVFFEMFEQEWRQQRGEKKIPLVAIVDDRPESQFLYPEFLLFQQLFQKFGVKAAIADPEQLLFREGKLWFQGEEVGLVYNRLTDFYLEEQKHQALRRAYEADAIVLTPAPVHHALLANKYNLTLLTDPVKLDSLSLAEETKALLLNGIPKTEQVTPKQATSLWERRRGFFFKPNAGFGSKATYRGEKMTRRVWEEILKGDYVAQALIPPTTRLIEVDDKPADLKIDLRVYTFNGKVQLLAARLYSGQTTNFRTTGGGFAPVFVIQG